MTLEDVLERFQALANPEKITLKQEKFGIAAKNALGIYQQDLKSLAKEIGYNDELAQALFDTGIYEARILCSKIFRPESLTNDLMETWVATFDTWEICDSFCMGFFVRGKPALNKIEIWSLDEREFVKRAAFTMMAAYGFAHKKAPNEIFETFLRRVEREAEDERIYVKKAVNWTLRNIGKRNPDLHKSALALATQLAAREHKAAKWVGQNALQEFRKPKLKMLNYPRSIYN